MKKGDTFLVVSPTVSKNHLRVVISDPDPSGEVLIVGITTMREGGDPSCVLAEGDHPFIRHPSRVAYEHAHTKMLSTLTTYCSGPSVRIFEPIAPSVLQRIQTGARNTDALKRKFKRFFALF